MTMFQATPERVIMAIELFPKHIQRSFLIDRMDIHLGYGMTQDSEGKLKLLYMDKPDEAEELLQIKLGAIRRCINIEQIFWHIQKPDRLMFLNFLRGIYIFDKKTYAKLLRDVWITTEFPHQMPNAELIRLFRNAEQKYLMTKDEVKALGILPEVIPIYRGLQYPKTRRKALSWTTKIEVAKWFATRWHKSGTTPPRIITSKIKKSDVYMYCLQRNESELVVNPNRLMKMSEVTV